MDPDADKIHNLMLDADLPSSINDLKNPTEDFIVKLISAFLQKFSIDVAAIDKPTCEQQQIMSYFDDSDITGLVNLHTVMAKICDRIFIKDFCISDITGPGPKRVRRLGRFLGNFILYRNVKQADIQEKIDHIERRSIMLQDLRRQKDEVRATINDTVLDTSKQMSLKEKYMSEVEKVQDRIEKNKQRKAELEAKINVAEGKKLQALEMCTSVKREVSKQTKEIAVLQSEAVTSPEQYKARRQDLEEQRKEQVEQREMMQEAFRHKKDLVVQLEKVTVFIQEQHDKFFEVKDPYNQLEALKVQGAGLKKQIEMLRRDANEMEMNLASKKTKYQTVKDDELKNASSKCEECISSLMQRRAHLLSKKKLFTEKVQEELARQTEARREIERIQDAIIKDEQETLCLLKNCQERYDNELNSENRFWSTWKGQ